VRPNCSYQDEIDFDFTEFSGASEMMGGYNLKEQQAKFDKLHTIFDKDKADYAHNLWLEKKKAHEGRETLNSLREKRALEFK